MLRFTRDHEWLRMDGDIATVGITPFAQEKLGDLVFVELPAVGAAFDTGAVAATVESVKAAADVYAPVGIVTSGGFAVSLNVPVAMGYVPPEAAVSGTRVFTEIRGKRLGMIVSKLPFVAARYKPR